MTDADVFASQDSRDRPLVADEIGVDDSVNVLRPAASPFISLRHPPQSHQQEVSLACMFEHHRYWLDQVGVALSAAA